VKEESFNGRKRIGSECVFTDEELKKILPCDESLDPVYHQIVLTVNNGPIKQNGIYLRLKNASTDTDDTLKKYQLKYRLEKLVEMKVISANYFSKANPYYEISLPYCAKLYNLATIKKIIPHTESLDLTFSVLYSDPLSTSNTGDIKEEKNRDISKKKTILSNQKKESEKRAQKYQREVFGPLNNDDYNAIANRAKRARDLKTKTEELVNALKDKNLTTQFVYWRERDLYRNSIDQHDRSLEDELIGDYNNFILGQPDNEKDIRAMLWDSDLFHILDCYHEGYERFLSAEKLANDRGINFNTILSASQISKGHILLHLNDLNGAKDNFLETLRNPDIDLLFRSRTLFRLGEVEVYQWDLDDAIKHFDEALQICKELDQTQKNMSVQHIEADSLRKKGTALRLRAEFDACYDCYNEAESIYKKWKIRGFVWLLHGWAEYNRAKGNADAALKMYESGLIDSRRILNINRMAHARLGMCEIFRLEKICKGGIDNNTQRKVTKYYTDAEKWYAKIHSNWGIVQIIISKSLNTRIKPQLSNSEEKKMINSLIDAKHVCMNMGLKGELALIKRIINEDVDPDELNPLSLF
jgi:hypothetical protein